MKVLQLSTGHLGGAGLAARRLNDQLNLHGINSSFFALAREGYLPSEDEVQINRNLFDKFIGSSFAGIQQKFSKQTLMSPISNSSNIVSRIRDFTKPEETIIQIHNWQNLIDFNDLDEFQNLGYKLILTLHDQRFFTGGCHYSFSCQKFESDCSNCPQVPKPLTLIPKYSFNKSMKFNIQKDSAVIIGPSRWIIDLAGQSRLLSNINGYVIPNVLGNEWVKNVQNISFRKNAKFTIGVASMNPNSYVKGGDIIQQTQSSLPASDYSFIFLSKFRKEEQAQFWEQIDCLFVPSRADNSPNVIHEAKSLGIPVVASNTGGIPEILTESDTCFDIPEKIDYEFAASIFERARSSNRLYEPTQILVDRIIKKDSAIIANYNDIYSQLLS